MGEVNRQSPTRLEELEGALAAANDYVEELEDKLRQANAAAQVRMDERSGELRRIRELEDKLESLHRGCRRLATDLVQHDRTRVRLVGFIGALPPADPLREKLQALLDVPPTDEEARQAGHALLVALLDGLGLLNDSNDQGEETRDNPR